MNRNRPTSRFLYATTLAALFVSFTALTALTACVASTDELDELGAAPDEGIGTTEGGVFGALVVGSELIATTNVNLRKDASTAATILDVVQSGDKVVVKAANAKNGFYNVEYNGVVGWSSGKYYKAAPPAPAPSTNPIDAPADLVALTSTCAQLAGTTKFAKDSGGSKTVPICQLNGALFWKADLDVDCDGGQGAACKADPYYQADTATVDSKGNPLDASSLALRRRPPAEQRLRLQSRGAEARERRRRDLPGKDDVRHPRRSRPDGRHRRGVLCHGAKARHQPQPHFGRRRQGVTYVAFTGATAIVTKKEDMVQASTIGQSRTAAVISSN